MRSVEENLKRQYENQLVAVKENEEHRRQRDVKQLKEELEMENLTKINNLQQKLLTTHNDQVNRMRQDHKREIERLMRISGRGNRSLFEYIGKLKQRRRRQQQERHEFAYFTMKNSSFACSTRTLLSLCRALWRILRAKMENLAG